MNAVAKGYKTREAALEASAALSGNPRVWWDERTQTYFGVGDTLLSQDGTIDNVLIGPRGRTVMASAMLRDRGIQ